MSLFLSPMHKPQNPLRLLLELRISRLPRGPQHDRQRVQQVAVRSNIGSGASLGDLLGEEVLACAYPAKGKRPPQLVRGGHAGGHWPFYPEGEGHRAPIAAIAMVTSKKGEF